MFRFSTSPKQIVQNLNLTKIRSWYLSTENLPACVSDRAGQIHTNRLPRNDSLFRHRLYRLKTTYNVRKGNGKQIKVSFFSRKSPIQHNMCFHKRDTKFSIRFCPQKKTNLAFHRIRQRKVPSVLNLWNSSFAIRHSKLINLSSALVSWKTSELALSHAKLKK